MMYYSRGLEYMAMIAMFAAITTTVSGGARADDTEIYQASYQSGSSGRPKVLILFDDSGSMGTIVQAGGERPDYDANATYVTRFNTDRVYWSDDQNPPGENTNKYFTASSNRCEESFTPLSTVGKFTSKARRWRPANGQWVTETTRQCVRYRRGRCRRWEDVEETYWDGAKAKWRSLNSNDQNPVHVDCRADVANPGNPGNGNTVANGYPYQPSAPDAANSEAYTGNRSNSNVRWGSSAYTFYSAHYMDWLYDTTIVSVEKNRMQIAQEVVNSLINANPVIDFGLAVFNDNTGGSVNYAGEINNDNDHGGRIVQRIVENMTPAQRAALAGSNGIVNDLSVGGWTPLCESYSEVYRYLAGDSVLYGDKRDTNKDSPARDLAAEDGNGNYLPPAADCAYTYVILMTDGYPTYDTDATSAIESLTGKTCGQYLTDHTDASGNRLLDKNCLPTLAEHMANRDLDGNANNGNQFAITYTIGFGTEQQLLEDAAAKGKGDYFEADNAAELTAAFQGAILSILSTDSTFTAPAVAVDTFTRVQSRNEVFFAMFKPDADKDWPGNIKRLDISFDSGSAVLEDKYGVPAIDNNSGLIKDTATTVWSVTADGAKVEKGGVGELLAATDLSTRANRLYTNSGVNEALQQFSAANIDEQAYGFNITDPANATALLFSVWGVRDRVELDEVIQWGIGYDTEDVDEDDITTDNRPWILADILHSKPQIINYGARGSYTEEDPDIRILVGTNAGFLHMFGNTDGEENWAFFAKELGAALSRRKQNRVSAERVYGIDAPVVVHTVDVNQDGTIDHTDGDTATVFFGLRRGGHFIYALDISNPDSPEFLWKISDEANEFAELGQTWSVPEVTRIPGYVDAQNRHKPVLIFGAGYDLNKDDHDTLAGDSNDSMGRGVFIVDAATGALVWSVTPEVNSTTNLQETGLLHSVPGSVTPLDSNGDEITDRIYFGDTGGNLWRIDMPFNSLPTASQNTWRIVKMFVANGGTQRTDRRFFNAPDVVRTLFEGYPVDTVMIGSGDRTNPAELDDPINTNNPAVDNQFYMIRDQQVSPYFNALDSVRCSTEPSYDFRCSLPLTTSALYDATDNLIQTGDDNEKEAALIALNGAAGWLMNLTANGEKNLARSLTINGKIYFPTFSPDALVSNICEPSPGTGRLYNVGLLDAKAVRDFNADNVLDRFLLVGGLIPDTPSPHFGEDGEIRLLLPPGGAAPNIGGNPLETNASLPQPYGSYWHRNDN